MVATFGDFQRPPPRGRPATAAQNPQVLELFECAVLLAQSADSFEDETKRKVEVGPTHPAALNEVLDRRGERA
jgi:hypothetical protein